MGYEEYKASLIQNGKDAGGHRVKKALNNGSQGGGGDMVLQARVQTQGNQHRVQMKWSPADGGSVNILRKVISSRQQPTTEKS